MASLWKNGNNKLICNSDKTKFIKCDECPCGGDDVYVWITGDCMPPYYYEYPATLPGNVFHVDMLPMNLPSVRLRVIGRWNLPLVFFWMDYDNEEVHIIGQITQTAGQNQNSITVEMNLNTSSVPKDHAIIVGLKWPPGHQEAFYCAQIYARY